MIVASFGMSHRSKTVSEAKRCFPHHSNRYRQSSSTDTGGLLVSSASCIRALSVKHDSTVSWSVLWAPPVRSRMYSGNGTP